MKGMQQALLKLLGEKNSHNKHIGTCYLSSMIKLKNFEFIFENRDFKLTIQG